jgi:long-chain fatty acid transport protein
MKNELGTENQMTCNQTGMHGFRTAIKTSVPLLLGLAVFAPTAADALGLRVPNQDADAIARGNAEAATADDPSAIYYNPAGITQLDGWNAEVGVHALAITSTYENPNGGGSNSKFNVQPVPQVYLTSQLKDTPFTVGLGVFVPYGLAIRWSGDASFRTAGIEGSLNYFTINPVLAAKLTDQLSVAIGPTINYSQILLEQGITPTSTFKYRGDGSAFGLTGGVRWQPCDSWSFGVKYHSPTSVSFDGTASTSGLGLGNSRSSVNIPFAQFAAAGVSYRPTTNWNFETDVDFTDWHSLDSITFNNTPLGNITKTFKWKSTYMFEVGATRRLDDGYYVSCGYFYSPNSTTQQYYSPLVPDTNLHVGSLGLGRKGEHWSWALAAQIITGPANVVTGNVDPTVDGSWSWLNWSVDASIGYHF